MSKRKRHLCACLLSVVVLAPSSLDAQTADVIGVLRQDGVVVLNYQRLPDRWGHAGPSDIQTHYFARTKDGARLSLNAGPVIDLLDDYDPVWGQLTDLEPVNKERFYLPIPRVGYVVSNGEADAPFRVAEANVPGDDQLFALLDSLAPALNSPEAAVHYRNAWRASLAGEVVFFFDASINLPARGCYAISGWAQPERFTEGVQIVQAQEHDCEWKGASRYQPWAVIRREGSLAMFLEHSGWESLNPELWIRDSGGVWRRGP